MTITGTLKRTVSNHTEPPTESSPVGGSFFESIPPDSVTGQRTNYSSPGCSPVLSVVPVPSEPSPLDTTEISIEDGIPQCLKADRVKLETRGVTSHRTILKQGRLWNLVEQAWKSELIRKLDHHHRSDLADKIRDCHTKKSVRQCLGCKTHSVFWNRCEIKWCPMCAQRLARERREAVEWWTKQIQQPKHIVLTMRNTEDLTRETIKGFKAAFGRLRRRSFAKNWRGGFYALEVTNESRGWHLHLHALVDARWIDSGALAREWADCVGQLFAIVKVKDAREGTYLKELTKYVVKGDQLVTWSAPDMVTLIEAFEGVRSFGVFGDLYGKRTEWKDFLDELRQGRVRCECGCDRWRVLSDIEFEWEEVTSDPTPQPIPPPRPTLHPEFPFAPEFPR